LIPNQGSLPSAGFGKQPATSPGPTAAAAPPAGNSGRDKDAGFSGQNQQLGSGKFRNSRPSEYIFARQDPSSSFMDPLTV
jgi:hypothetical protein